jgi:murein peptide amidase A
MLRRIKAIPRLYWLAAVVGLSIGAITVTLWPQTVTFSYQSATCIGHPVLAPGLLIAKSEKFKIETASVMQAGSIPVGARGVCFTPLSIPEPGDYTVVLSNVWLPFIGKVITVHVPNHPIASAKQLKEPIPLSKKLVVGLSTTDRIFTYQLNVADKSVECEVQSLGVGCDIEQLGLEQGTTYTLKLERYFKKKRVGVVLETEFSTLKAVALISSTIKQGEIVYNKPKSITLEFDKEISLVEVNLMQIDGQKKQTKISQNIKNREVTLSWTEDLTRQQTYQLEFKKIEAIDGSHLMSPRSVDFKTSGGPKVTNINVGTYKVSAGTVATLNFDQPIADDQDISSIITATGGARIVSKQGSKVTISFAGVPKCGSVTIKITDSLKSNYGITGGSAWQYTTRTICQTVISIGSSAKGRSILGYIFGNGPKRVVYTGAIHGDEVSTRSLMLRWIDALEAHPGSIPADKTVVIIPVINPDGYAAGMRRNARNIDLNRNFATNDWKSDITTETNQPLPGGGGPSPLSEPESAALANYIAGLHPSLVLSYHSIGGLVMANQAGNSPYLANRYASLSGYSNSTGSSTAFDYSVSGTADDYYGEKLGVASILIELGSHTNPQFDRNQPAMWAMLRET